MNLVKSIKFAGGVVNTLCKAASFIGTNSSMCKIYQNTFQSQLRAFSLLSTNLFNTNKVSSLNLTPKNVNLVPACGMKCKGKLKRRCKACYYARIDGRMYILCDAYPRHKQMAMVKREKYTWILTSCSQHKLRPY